MTTYTENSLTDINTGIPAKINEFRLTPNKIRNYYINRNIQPLANSVMHQRKKIMTKDDINKLNNKISIIKSKCMNKTIKIIKNQSKNTFNSTEINNQYLNQSLDLDSQDFNQNKKGNCIHLNRSIFQNRPATVFFKYPKCCGIEEENRSRVYALEKVQLYYKISGSEYKCIVNSLQCNGFEQVSEGNQWSVYFDVSGTHLKALQNMNKHQKVNHFPGCWMIGRKDYMWKNLSKQRRAHPEAYNFVPNTFIFPADYDRFELARQTSHKNKLWIMKPTNQACGRGIKMIKKQTTIKKKKDILVSQYISNPHLINNFKYDLRIYVLVTSYDPLRIYMFKQGLTRFATYQYNTKAKNISKRFIHLTNFSVNRHSQKFIKNKKEDKDGQGSKWSLSALKKYYESIGINVTKLFDDIKDVIIKTCISAEPVMLDIHSKTQQKRTCGFQLYGFDILIDQNLKPWLMEVNVCPSLGSSSPMDRKIKHTLLTDILNLIGIQFNSKKTLKNLKKNQKNRLLTTTNTQKKFFSKNVNMLQFLNYSNCLDLLCPQDWLILFQSQQQMSRLGHFQRIFPNKNNIESYKRLFEINRYNNNFLWKHLQSDRNFLEKLYV